MSQLCDLHAHSVYSDGTYTPRELIREAEKAGLSALVLSDHDTVAGLPEFLAAAEDSPVEAIPGVEFSTQWEGTELHILGLFVKPEHYGAVNALVADMLERKERSHISLLQKLSGMGVSLDYGVIKASTPNGQVNRAVIAAEMVRLGYCGSVHEAFTRWLSAKLGYYVAPKRPEALDVIGFIKSIGAVAVLAHPFLNLDEARLRQFIPEAKTRGLDAMEVCYPLFDARQTAIACAIAEEFGLLHSGGSDFHGANKPDIRLGTGRGALRISMELLEKLRKCRR